MSFLAIFSAVLLGVSVLLFVEGPRRYAVVTFSAFLITAFLGVAFGGVVIGLAILIFSCIAVFGACAIGVFGMMIRS